jgi:hypothetical protein
MKFFFSQAIVVVATLTFQTNATAAKGIERDSREYKLMLVPERFAGGAPQEAVRRFARDQLEPAVRRAFGDEAAEHLKEKGLVLKEFRQVSFWDTSTCVLFENGFALRERVDLDQDGRPASKPEITLKLRSPDPFLAADMLLKAEDQDDDKKFEEDVSPLAVRNAPGSGLVAMPRSSRSQFSKSITKTLDRDAEPETLKHVEKLYPTLDEDLRLLAGEIDMSEALVESREYGEQVYESSKLDLGTDTQAEFALTLWYEGVSDRVRPALAEISFTYKTDDGGVPGEVAGRARKLFLAIQDLDWADPGAPTKTALVGCPD